MKESWHLFNIRHDRRLLSLLGFVHNWPTSRYVCNKKKENRFSLNGNGIMSSFLGRQFYRSTLYRGNSINKRNFLDKWKYIFFRNLFPLMQTLHCLESIHYKKLFLFGKNICCETIQNGRKWECSRLEQRSVIRCLMAEKYKPCKIYSVVCTG